jgi:RHS repeat-associated protein
VKGIRLIAAFIAVLLALAAASVALAEQDESGSSSEGSSSPQPVSEIASERTATSRTFRLEDGAREARIYETPVNYRGEDGTWKPIEDGLQEGASAALENGNNSFDLSMPRKLGKGPVRITTEGDWVESELLGSETEAVDAEGNSAVYEAASSGVDFELMSLASGLKEDIVLDDPSQPHKYSYLLKASDGLAPERGEDGSIVFRDGDEQAILILPAPLMVDSRPGPPAVSRAAEYQLSARNQGEWLLTLEADPEWISDPDRVLPIHLDPSITVPSPTLDCDYLLYGTSTTSTVGCGSTGFQRLRAQYKPANGAAAQERERSIFKFSTSSIPSTAYVANATVGLYAPWEGENALGAQLRRAKISKEWSSSVDWFHFDSGHSWVTPGGDFTEEGAEVLGHKEGWWKFSSEALAGVVEGWTTGKITNQGLFLKLKEEEKCQPPSCTDSWLTFNSSAASEKGTQPYLAVTYYPKAPSSSKVVSPIEGTVSANRLKLKSKWSEPGVTGITFEYKTGTGRYQKIPSNLIHNAKGEEVSWPLAVEGFESQPLYFDAGHANAELTEKGGEVLVRANFTGPTGIEGFSEAAKAKIDPDKGGPKDAAAQAGPCSVDLLTGSCSISRTDVSISGVTAGLEFSRTYSSRSPGVAADTSALGRGWKTSTPVEVAGGSEWRSVKLITTSAEEKEEGLEDYAQLTDSEGYEYAFEQVSGTYVSPPEATGYVLAHTAGSATFTLSDPAGNVTAFENVSGGVEYQPVAVSLVGSSNTVSMVYKIEGTNRRLTKVIAPNPGVSCTSENNTTWVGCRSLVLNYQPATTWGAPASYGERLSSITYYGPTSQKTMSSWTVAQYKYDSSGRLIAEWDPRISPVLEETYSYVGSGESTPQGGEIKTITPPGLEPWTLEYATLSGEASGAGRLKSVKRASLVEGTPTAQTTVAYQVPISGAGAPYAMGGSSVAKWGQQDIPTDATAVLPPDEPELKGYARATVYYMDAEGQQVNVATPSGAGTEAPSITTTETDEYGNVVRELSAQNRLRALSAGSEAEMIAKSHELETKREYSAEGTQLSQEWGPMHQVRLEGGESVSAQLHTTIQYNEGWPGTGVNPHLPTRVTTGAKIPKKGEDADQRVTETKYDWNLRLPIETLSDPGTGHLNLKSRTAYNSIGQVTETSMPAKSEGGDAHTTKLQYYANGSGECGEAKSGKEEGLVGQPCKKYPAAQPGGSLPELLVTKYPAFNQLGEATEVVESPGGGTLNTRKTIITYDSAGRETSKKTEGGGTSVLPSETHYNKTTGLLVERDFICEPGCDTQAVVTAYDKLGRPVQYTDADGNTSKTTYDLDGRTASVYDGKGTQTFGYDSTSGLLTKLEDSAVGTFTAAYNADGATTDEGLPDGLIAKTTYDEAGEPTALSYVKTSCSEKCTWLEESNERSIYGQILAQKSLASSEQYSYDKTGRLTSAKETPTGGECTTRIYAYEGEAGRDSNRTSMTTRAPEIGGACASKGGTATSYSYDAADRLTGEGITYDSFGRITSLSGKYAGGSTLTTSFYSNEMIATQSQAGLTNSYQLDATGRVRQVTQSGTKAGTEVFHYAMASDSTAWTERGGAWTRSVAGIGSLGAIQPSSGEASLLLADLHGDVVATASLSPTAKEPTAKFEFEEFGNPVKGSAGRYGWLGKAGRRTELPSGVIQMGVRSYVPAIGRFLAADPVPGGSANAYDYADADPVNGFDLGGTCSRKRCGGRGGRTTSITMCGCGINTHRHRKPSAKHFEVGPCTFSTVKGADYRNLPQHNVVASVSYSCDRSVTLGGFLWAQGQAGPPTSERNTESGTLNMALKFTSPTEGGLSVCVVVLWGEEGSARKCATATYFAGKK